jgi:transcriptional regulator with XRE-family HTH domain
VRRQQHPQGAAPSDVRIGGRVGGVHTACVRGRVRYVKDFVCACEHWKEIVTPRGLGERLASLRARSSASQDELAQSLGIRRATWSLWENGHRVPDTEMLARIARHFGASADWLLFGDEGGAPAVPPERPGSDLLPIHEDERQLLVGYRKLDVGRQQVALEMVRGVVAAAARAARQAKAREKQRESGKSKHRHSV